MSTGRARNTRKSRLALFLGLTTAIFLIQPPTPVFGQKQSFVATGRAKLAGRQETAQRRALENALWLAVEQAIHTLVPAATRAEHAQSINSVLARPRELVTGYEIIQRGPSRGYFVVRVKATVAMETLTSRLRVQAVPLDHTAVEARVPPPMIQAAPAASPPAQPAPSAEPSGGQSGVQKATPAPAPASTPQAAPPTPSKQQSQAAPDAPRPEPRPGRPRIAVLLFQLGFTNPQWAQSWDVSLGVTELVEAALHESGRYRIVERRQIEEILKEQGFGSSGSVSAATAAKIGRILGVQRLVMGTVNQLDLKAAGGIAIPGFLLGLYQAQVGLTSRVVDTSTAEIVAIVRGSGKSEGLVALAQLQGLAFGGGEFRQSILGKALDQSILDLVGKLNGSMNGK